MVIYCIFKISSFFGNYLENSTVKRGGQPHGSDQCGYLHLPYRLVFGCTVIEVGPLCRLGWVVGGKVATNFSVSSRLGFKL